MVILKKYKFHLLFLTCLLLLIFLTYKDYGIVWDERYYLDTGKYYVTRLFGLLNIKTNLVTGNFYPSKVHLTSHGVLFDIASVFLTLFFKKFTLETYHLIKALMAMPIFILIGLIIYQLTNEWISLGTMMLLLLFPRFYGDMFQNSVDIPTTLSLSLLVGYFIYYLRSKKKLIQQVGLGLISAIVVSQRIILGYIFILNFLTIFLIGLYKKRSIATFFGEALTISGFFVLFLHLTHPYLFSHPLKGLFDMLSTSKSFPFAAAALFEGSLVWAYQLPWYYLPKLILVTTPLITILLFIAGFFYLIYLFLTEKKDVIKKFSYLYLLLIFVIPIVVVIWFKPILYDSWRHFLFLSAPIVLIAAFGLLLIMNIKKKLIKTLLFIAVGVNLLFTVKEMIILHPYQYIYYNFLVGGLKGAYNRYETDYWGAGYKEAITWFNKNINKGDRVYRIISEGDPLSSSYYFKKNMILTNNPYGADYFISFTRWWVQDKYSGKIVHKVERESVPLIFIKKLN